MSSANMQLSIGTSDRYLNARGSEVKALEKIATHSCCARSAHCYSDTSYRKHAYSSDASYIFALRRSIYGLGFGQQLGYRSLAGAEEVRNDGVGVVTRRGSFRWIDGAALTAARAWMRNPEYDDAVSIGKHCLTRVTHHLFPAVLAL